MRILAIESAASVASVALVDDEKILFDYTINDKKTHSQTIMPMIEAMKKQLGIDLSTIDAIAVSCGPGSYTGLRIGSATAKGLAHVLGIPIIGVSTLDSMSRNIGEAQGIICPMLDARRQHVFAAAYRYVDGAIESVIPIDQYSVVELLEKLSDYDENITFLGDGYLAHRDLIEKSAKGIGYSSARPSDFIQKAVNIGLIGLERLGKGETDDYLTHQPNYYRLSQAEREYEERKNAHS